MDIIYNNTKTSLYKTCRAKTNQEVSLMGLMSKIQHGDYDEIVTELRSIKGKKERQEFKSKNFPAFTWSATFNGGHNYSDIKNYSSLVGLDYDDVTGIDEVIEKLKTVDSTFIAFVSPSGNGIKVIVKVNSSLEKHKEAFELINKYYANIVGLESDPSVKDPTRLCYVSHDPNIYINEDSMVFDVLLGIQYEDESNIDINLLFKKAMLTFTDGNRHSTIVSCSGTANLLGIEKQSVIDYFKSKVDSSFTVSEIESTVNDIYQRYINQFDTAVKKNIPLINSSNSLSPPNWFNSKGKLVYKSLIEDLSNKIVTIPEIGRVFAKSETGSPVFKEENMNMSFEDFYFFLYDYGAIIDDGKFTKLLKSDKIDKINQLTVFSIMVSETKWDSVDRINQLIDGMNLDDKSEEVSYLLRKYFYTMYAFGLRGIDLKMEKNSYSRVALILHSQARGTGKTSFLRMLGMDGKIEEWTGIEGLEIYCQYAERPSHDKDDFDNNKSSKLIINFDDIQDFLIKSGGHLRSLISEDSYSQRKKYDRNSKAFKRRCAFAGSTNHEEIMNDNDENRYLIVSVEGLMDFELFKKLDMLQFWAQVRHDLITKGEDCSYNSKDLELIKIRSQKYMYNSNTDEVLSNYFVFDPNPEPRLSFAQIEEIMRRNGRYFKGNELGYALKKLAPAGQQIKKKSGDSHYYLVKVKGDLLDGGITIPNSLMDDYKGIPPF
jgi:hypothetical protein